MTAMRSQLDEIVGLQGIVVARAAFFAEMATRTPLASCSMGCRRTILKDSPDARKRSPFFLRTTSSAPVRKVSRSSIPKVECAHHFAAGRCVR